MRIEEVILSGLIFSETYTRKVIPFLKDEYFHETVYRTVFNLINEYMFKYNMPPPKEALLIELEGVTNLSTEAHKECGELVESLGPPDGTMLEWLVDQTEQFCKDKALYNALMAAIKIVDSSKEALSVGAIPQLMADALAVSFDTSIGHDFFDNSDERYDSYHAKEDKFAFDLEYFNKITKGGLSKKTLNIALAGTGVGKSLFMCHCAAFNLLQGMNVLYITLEMSEERIAERIDANLLDIPLSDLKKMSKDKYQKMISNLSGRSKGKLVIKEYPTSYAGSANFRHLINELKLKRAFVPDIIYIDYLNICSSSRIKQGANVNSYTYIKAIAEELRGLAVEFNVPLVSATQTTRSGFNNSDVGLEDTSESFGLPMTADFMFALVTSAQLEELDQIMVKQLKNRYGDLNYHKKFVVGIDRSRMRLYDVEQSAQKDIIDDGEPFQGDSSKFNKNRFDGFK